MSTDKIVYDLELTPAEADRVRVAGFDAGFSQGLQTGYDIRDAFENAGHYYDSREPVVWDLALTQREAEVLVAQLPHHDPVRRALQKVM
jgi:poly-gamma-glutamate capsule biosynthesis protein CapA/YwtB (metallophosphatase superfamily)